MTHNRIPIRRMLPDGRVSLNESNTMWRFERKRPYYGKLWSGQYYSVQPSYVVYSHLDIEYMWARAGQPVPTIA
jgi:hypothetical protein